MSVRVHLLNGSPLCVCFIYVKTEVLKLLQIPLGFGNAVVLQTTLSERTYLISAL